MIPKGSLGNLARIASTSHDESESYPGSPRTAASASSTENFVSPGGPGGNTRTGSATPRETSKKHGERVNETLFDAT